MSKKQWYAVKVGRTPGLYRSWDDCERQVKGFRGARFKGFVFKDQAETWIGRPEKAKRGRKKKRQQRSKAFKHGPFKPKTTNLGMKNLYCGDIPPWEYPVFIGCIDHEVNVNNFSWKTA